MGKNESLDDKAILAFPRSHYLFYIFRFRIDNTDHIIDVNQDHIMPLHYDQVNIICPFYPKSIPIEDTESFMIYQVNKEEYDTCNIRSQNPRIIAACNSPYMRKFFTLSFRIFSPIPGGMEFKPGNDYHFISTSSKTDLHQRINGMCRDFNMKVVFKVAERSRNKKKEFVDNLGDKPLENPSTSNPVKNVDEIGKTSPKFNEREISLFEKDPFAKSLSEQHNVLLNEESENKNNRRKNKRKRKRKQRNKNRSNNNLENEDEILQDKSSVILLDSAAAASAAAAAAAASENRPQSKKVLEKEPSLVEKVNNLMKQEASISSHANSNHISLFHIVFCSICFITTNHINDILTKS